MARPTAGHSFSRSHNRPVNIPDPAPPAPERPRFSLRLVVALGLAVIGLAVLLRPSTPLLPIPTPARLDTLDPQIRAHLAQLARRIADAPRDPNRRSDMGLAFAVNGLWAEARQCFTNALQLGGPQPLPALYAAVALQELGDDATATRELEDLVRRFPEFAPGWHRLGRAHVAAGQFPAATRAFQEVTRLAPNQWHGWAGLGEVHIRAGSPADAVPTLEKARQLAPTARSVRHLLAQAYRAAGRNADADREAAAGASQSLGPMPDDWSLDALNHMKSLADQFERADTLLANGQPAEAIARLGEALRFHPTNTTVVAALARTLNAAGQHDTAWNLLTNTLSRSESDVLLFARAAETAAALERPDDALAFARRALELAPRSAEARIAEANALLAANRDAEAVASLEQALALAPRDTQLHVQLGDVLWQNLGDRPRAIETWNRARSVDPLNTAALSRLAQAALAATNRAEADRWILELESLGTPPPVLRQLRNAAQSLPTLPSP